MTEHFTELSKKYGLSETVLAELFEHTVRECLIKKTGHQVECYLNGRLEIFTYHEFANDLTEIEEDAESFIKQIGYRELKKKLMTDINSRIIENEYNRLKQNIGSMVYGSVLSIEDGYLLVNPSGIVSDCEIEAVCLKQDQTKRERKKYIKGRQYIFMIKNVFTVDQDNGIVIKITLSRTSKKLVERYLTEEIRRGSQLQNISLKVTQRYAGQVTRVSVSYPIPLKIIKKAGREFNEAIIWTLV